MSMDEQVRELDAARADPARRFGRFVLLSEIGRGGMGAVHRAWDEKLRRLVALKTILGTAGLEPVERFHREAEAVARLKHPNIVALHDSGETNGRHFIVMELVAGDTLRARVVPRPGRAPLSRGAAVAALRDVARAVQHAHEQGVIHRDLKPDNIILDAQDRPHVVDFGLVRFQDGRTQLTETGVGLGTVAYMPPEQANGSGAEQDGRCDVYALGATLYFALSGYAPFEGASEVNVVNAVLTKRPTPLRARDESIPRDLEAICARCLEKAPADRYATAGELADDLDRHLAGAKIDAALASPPRALYAAGFVLLAAGAAGTGLYFARRGPPRTPRPPEQPAAVASRAAPREPTRRERAERRAAEADALLAGGQLVEAARAASEAIELSPDVALAWLVRGEALLAAKEAEKGLADLSTAIARDPRLVRALLARATLRWQRRERPGALEDVERILALDAKHARALAMRAEGHLLEYELADAAADAGRAVESEPDLRDAWLVRATARLGLDDIDGAIADCDRVLALDPRSAPALARRGEARIMRHAPDDLDVGRSDVDRALEIDPENAVAYFARGMHHVLTQRPAKGFKDYNRAIELDPGYAEAYAFRGAARGLIALDVAGAVRDYDEALRLAPKHPKAANVKAQRDLAAMLLPKKD